MSYLWEVVGKKNKSFFCVGFFSCLGSWYSFLIQLSGKHPVKSVEGTSYPMSSAASQVGFGGTNLRLSRSANLGQAPTKGPCSWRFPSYATPMQCSRENTKTRGVCSKATKFWSTEILHNTEFSLQICFTRAVCKLWTAETSFIGQLHLYLGFIWITNIRVQKSQIRTICRNIGQVVTITFHQHQ